MGHPNEGSLRIIYEEGTTRGPQGALGLPDPQIQFFHSNYSLLSFLIPNNRDPCYSLLESLGIDAMLTTCFLENWRLQHENMIFQLGECTASPKLHPIASGLESKHIQ